MPDLIPLLLLYLFAPWATACLALWDYFSQSYFSSPPRFPFTIFSVGPVQHNTIVRPFIPTRLPFTVSISGVHNSNAQVHLSGFPSFATTSSHSSLHPALEAGDTFNVLVRKLQQRHVLKTSRTLRPSFHASDSLATFRGADLVPFALPTLSLHVTVGSPIEGLPLRLHPPSPLSTEY
jgi:hypothetical protein